MGKGSAPVIGYWYHMGLHMGLCAGPIDALLQIKGGTKVAWEGNITASGPITIAKPQLYGGEKKEGGIDGNGWVAMGEADQQPDPYLQGQLGAPTPAFRGLACVIFRGRVGAISPTVKKWSFKVARFTAGWRTPVWQASLCTVGKGMNAAHILYRVVTDPVTGMGKPESTLDLPKMLAAAQTLSNEGFGLCLKWTRADVYNNFIQVICDHVGGVWVDDAASGLRYIKLLRADYDIDTIPLIDESNIVELSSFQSTSPQDTVNQMTVKWHDCDTDKDATVTAHNLANIQAQGSVVAQSKEYPGIWNQGLATRALMRDLTSMSAMPAKLKCKVFGSVDVAKGDVVAFSWTDLHISRMPMRVLSTDRGDGTSDVVTLTCAQDVFALPTTSYVTTQPGKWQAPTTTPIALTYQTLVEASYRDLAARLRQADLNTLDATSSFIGSLGADPVSTVAYNYTLLAAPSGGALTEVASGEFAPTGTLTSAMVAEPGPSVVTVANTSRLDQVKTGTEVKIEDEICRVDAIDPQTGTVTLARGCVDTVPQTHAAATRVWFTDGYTAVDTTEYLNHETINAKLLTRTSEGELDQSVANQLSIVVQARQALPYPPGHVQINGQDAPSSIDADMTVTWARRNRITQGDTLVDTTAGDITPPADVRESLAFYDASSNLIIKRDDIDDTTAAVVLDYTGTVTMVLATINDNGDSLQQQTRTFDYTPPVGTTQGTITAATWTP